MGIQGYSRLNTDIYLKHKEHFDSGLVSLLERKETQLCKCKQKEVIYKATISKKNATIKQQKNKIVCLETIVFKYKTKDKEQEIDLEYIKEEIRKINKEIEEQKQAYIEEIEQLKQENEKLRKQNEQMKYRRHKIKADSMNSSMPPSSDIQVRKNINTRVKSEKTRGGQINHVAHQSKLSKAPTVIETKYVKKAPQGAVAKYNDTNEKVYYVTQEIDFCMRPQIIETRYYIDENGQDLDIKVSGKYKINSVTYSDHFKAAVLYLHCKGTIPLQRLCKILEELSEGQIQLKESTVCKWVKKFHQESAPTREKIMNDILDSSNVGVDESGWKVNGKRSWLHAITTKEHVYYVMTKKRSDEEDGPIALLQGYDGKLSHDHFKPYYQLLTCKHIECNAHVLRYLQKGIEEYDNVACVKLKQLFTQTLHKRKELKGKGIHQFSEEEKEKITKEYEGIIQEELKKFTEENPKIAAKYTPDYIKLMRRLLVYKENHLAYVNDFDVPFDNNASERAIRVAKAKKKISGQSYTIESANYYASLLTVIQNSYMKKENALQTIEKIIQS